MESDGRSPFRPRQLHDLRLQPTATDPRPMFVWSAESPRDLMPTETKFAQLLWHGVTNQEITVHSVEERDQKIAAGYKLLPISSIEIDQVQSLSEQLASLTEQERNEILQAQNQSRLDRLTSELANLSDADLDRLLARNTAQQIKRKAG